MKSIKSEGSALKYFLQFNERYRPVEYSWLSEPCYRIFKHLNVIRFIRFEVTALKLSLLRDKNPIFSVLYHKILKLSLVQNDKLSEHNKVLLV